MNCNDVRENLIELLTDGPADPQVKAHVSQCSACTEELGSMRKTMALLDEWESPEPSPYFLTRLRAHVKEEREKAPAGMFGWLRRPMLAAALATVLAAGGVVYRLTVGVPPVEPGPGTAVADIESLDKNHDLIIDTDLVNELTGAPSDD
ncbi:MAG: anti-sigma factor family protein, partial [Candidatus Angelobacter sp.]